MSTSSSQLLESCGEGIKARISNNTHLIFTTCCHLHVYVISTTLSTSSSQLLESCGEGIKARRLANNYCHLHNYWDPVVKGSRQGSPTTSISFTTVYILFTAFGILW